MQHTPSTQFPLWHSGPVAQVSPFGRSFTTCRNTRWACTAGRLSNRWVNTHVVPRPSVADETESGIKGTVTDVGIASMVVPFHQRVTARSGVSRGIANTQRLPS